MRRRAGFSLVEVLIAVMILALGVISIAALFPAGIAQQRFSNDDFMGPVVANHAMSVIRDRVRPSEFGDYLHIYEAALAAGWIDADWAPWYRRFSTFDPDRYAPAAFFSRTQLGDTGWIRPGYVFAPFDPTEPERFHTDNAIDIFSHFFVRRFVLNDPIVPDFEAATEHPQGWPYRAVWNDIRDAAVDPPLYGIPYNLEVRWGEANNVPIPPRRIITQRERYYPVPQEVEDETTARPYRPQYVWDCMFRRYPNGSVSVAVFVYRVSSPTAGSRLFMVQPNSAYRFPSGISPNNIGYSDRHSPLPFKVDLRDLTSHSDWYETGTGNMRGAWDLLYEPGGSQTHISPYVFGTRGGQAFDADDPRQAWQLTRQWLLDQNNRIHRVLSRSRVSAGDRMEIELTQSLSAVSAHPFFRNRTVEPTAMPSITPVHPVPFRNYMYPTASSDYYYDVPDSTANPNSHIDRGVVSEIWYIPRTVIDVDENGVEHEWTLTPVYVAVKELE